MIHGMSGLTQTHLYVIQINSLKFHFIEIVKLTVFKIFEERFEIEILKIGNLKFEIIGNLNFINWEFSKFKTKTT